VAKAKVPEVETQAPANMPRSKVEKKAKKTGGASVGQSIRRLRKSSGFSLQQLAEQTGLSAAYLSQVENDQANPTLSALRKIAQALGTSVFYVLAHGEVGAADCVQVNKGERVTFKSPGFNPVYELLTRSYPQSRMQALYICLEPGMDSCDEPMGHGSWDAEEWTYVIDGELVFEIGSEQFSLTAGDAVHFRAALPHKFRNVSNQKAHLLCVMCPPTF